MLIHSYASNKKKERKKKLIISSWYQINYANNFCNM